MSHLFSSIQSSFLMMHATERARSAVAGARAESRAASARGVGPEFLLLALARADCSLAAITLDSMGVDRPRLVSDLLKRVAADETRHAQEGSIDSCIRRADDLARASHHSLIGTQHLLLAVVEAHSDEIVRMPSAKALTFGRVNAELSSLLS